MADTPAPAPNASSADVAAAASAAPAAEAPAAVEEKIKLKVRKHKQRSCDEKGAKGKLCAGHLKRWYDYPKEVEALVGPGAEIYRCEFCQTLYRPDPQQMPNSYTLNY
ncbi:MAG: hypothetical protein WA871_15420 [Candidatus Acidiferrales bacterium]